MATGWPMKTTYANGDVYSASDVNDTNGTINLLGSSVAYTAGKNRIINGDFGVWQRGTSITTSNAAFIFTCDRFRVSTTNTLSNTGTVTRQAFTPGAAPISGYESSYFARLTMPASGTTSEWDFTQPIEDVRTFAGQTVTLSFWAKSSASAVVNLYLSQVFGGGGSSTVNTNFASIATLTSSWVRYTKTFTVPSISGKTIGTNNFLDINIYQTSPTASQTIDFWGWQLEQGSTATAFQTATGTIQGELAACQRYYYQNATGIQDIMNGAATSNVQGRYSFCFPTQMRIAPTSLVTQNLSNSLNRTGGVATGGTFSIGSATPLTLEILYVHGSAAWTAGDTLLLYGNNANSYYGWSAEL